MRARAATVVAGVAGALLLAGCRTPAVQRQLIVDFVSLPTSAQQQAVRAACQSLPGIVAEPVRRRDAAVFFDVSRASDRQLSALANCVDQLASSQPALAIRGYRIDDGSQD